MKLALGILIMIAFSEVAVIVTHVPTTQIVSAAIPKQYDGVTVCSQDNQPVIVLQEGVAGTDVEAIVLVHEMTHVRQNLAYKGGCKEFSKRYNRDSVFRMKMETEAYCAQLPYVTKVFPDQVANFMAYLKNTAKVSCGGKNETPRP